MGLYINKGELRDRAGVSLVTQKARKTQKYFSRKPSEAFL